MKALVLDTGVVITLSLNNLLGKVNLLKKDFKGEFFITEEVERELITKPLQGKKYKLEALQIKRLLKKGVLKVYRKKIDCNSFLELCNKIYRSKDYVSILDKGEVESFVLAKELKGTYVVDERTMRMLVEDSYGLKDVLERKLRKKIEIDMSNLGKFKEFINDVKIIRSSELMFVAFEKGYFKELGSKDVLDALLWGLKLRGCAISSDEINELKRM